MNNGFLLSLILAFIPFLSAISGFDNDSSNSNFVQDIRIISNDSLHEKNTVMDKYGLVTGMTKEEFEIFKERYHYVFPYTEKTDDFDCKINHTKRRELNNLGAFHHFTYQYNTLHCDIIVIGEITETEGNQYIINVEEFLKGKEILISKLGIVPKTLRFISPYASGYWVSNDNEPVLNAKGIFFLREADKITDKRNYLAKVSYSTVLYSNKSGYIYESHIRNAKDWLKQDSSDSLNFTNEKKFLHREKWNKVITDIKNILEINDSKNFYKIKL
jgi:hypothetical protein